MLMVAENNSTTQALALAEQEWGPPAEAIDGVWYIVLVEPQQEASASAWMRGWRFPVYVPKQPKSVRSNYLKRRVVMRPMLPGYVLTSFDVKQNTWKNINSFPGVRRILMVDERPVPVPEAALYFIRKEEARAAADFGTRKRMPMPCKLGDWVQIIEHPSFGGFFGRVTQLLAGRERIVLNVDLFGRQTPVEVSANQVRVV